MRTISILTAFSVFLTLNIFAQNSEEFFKTLPPIDDQTPEWAVKMYSENPNVWEVQYLHDKYFRENPYQKDIHQRNYLHWLMQIEERVQPNGFIGKARQLPERYASRGSQANWTAIGPFETLNLGSEGNFPVSWQTNIYCLDQSQQDPDIVIAGTEAGDLFKSVDRGLNWVALTEGLQVRTVTACAIAPSDSNQIWFSSGNNMYKSTDGGGSWNSMVNFSSNPYEICVNPQNPNVVWAVGGFGLQKTVDGGSNWSSVYSDKCWDIDYHVNDTTRVYLLKTNGTAKKAEFFRSTNGGSSFAVQTSGWFTPSDLSNASDGGARIAVTKAAPDMVVVGLLGAGKANDNGWIGVYVSHNQGQSWSNPLGQDGSPYNGTTIQNLASFQPNGSGFHQGFYNYGIDVSDVDSNTIWVGCLALSRTTDGGVTWERIGGYYAGSNSLPWIHPDIQDIHVQDSDVWIASDGGINYSSNELTSHDSRKYGIYGSDFWGFGQGWNEDVLVGGRYHNGNSGFFQTYGLGNSLRLGGAEAPTGYVNPLKDRKTYFSDVADKVIPDSIHGTVVNTYSLARYPNTSYSTSESSEIEFDHRYAEHMIIGADSSIYKSTDEGRTFNALYTFPEGVVYEIEIPRSNPDVMYCAYRPGTGYWTWSQIYKSTDGGVSWTKLSDPPAANRHRMELAVNPFDENELWGMSASKSHVFKTTDGGATWVNMETAALSNQSIKDIRFQAGSDVVYLATYTDVFYYDSGQGDWENYSTGLPGIVTSLQMIPYYRDCKLRVATRGKGIWESDMAIGGQPGNGQAFLPHAQPMTTNDVITCSRDTVPFDCHSFLLHDSASWAWSFSPAPLYVSDTSQREVKVVFGASGSYAVTLAVTDKFGNSDTTTVMNMVTVSNECGVDTVPGTAMHNTSVGDYATTPLLDFTTNTVTFMAWVKPDGVQPDYSAIAINSGATGGVNFRGGNNTLGYHWPGGAWWWDSGMIVPADEWSHIAMVATPDSMSVYLNGVRKTHVAQLDSIYFDVVYIGSYKAWTSRNFFGDIDELRMWKRSLSQEEIREMRHLTLDSAYVANDTDLVFYYQFNETGGPVLDRKGLNHAGLNGGASRVLSTGPFGGGESDRVAVTSTGPVNFPNTNTRMHFGSTGNIPNGEVVVSRIHVLPDSFPSDKGNTGGYFVVNNYGSGNVTALDSVELSPFGYTPPAALTSGLTDAYLYNRGENEFLDNWQQNCVDDTVLASSFHFGSTCNLSNLEQWFIGISACAQSSNGVNICAGDSILINGNYETQSGTFYQIISLPQGCDSLAETVLTVDTSDASVNQSGITLSAMFNADTYQWIDCSNMQPISGETSSSFTPTANGNYALITTVGNCSDTSTCVNVIVVGISDSRQSLKVYPNPVAKGKAISIENLDAGSTRMIVISSDGKVVKNELLQPGKAQVDMSGLPSGMYLYKLISSKKIVNGTLVVQ